MKWLVDTFGLTAEDAKTNNNYAFRCVCSCGHLEVSKWLVDRFGLTINDIRCFNNWAFRYACTNGHLKILEFIIGGFQLSEDDYRKGVNENWIILMTKACEEENRFMVGWFVTKFENKEILEEWKGFVEVVINEDDVMIKPASKHFV